MDKKRILVIFTIILFICICTSTVGVTIYVLLKDRDFDFFKNEDHTLQKESIEKVQTLSDLESSEFYETYAFEKDESWKLAEGGENTVYKSDQFKGMEFEVQTMNDDIFSIDLIFFTSPVQQKELIMVGDLLELLSGTEDSQMAVDFIEENVEKEKDGDVLEWDMYKISAYESLFGGEQVIVIEKVE